jgi:hypothetical protein
MTGLIPSRGLCHAVFLLIRAAHLSARPLGFAEWVDRARRQSTFMATALDLDDVAQRLVDARLVDLTEPLTISQRLSGLWQTADSGTFLAIARALLEACPPHWLDMVVSPAGVHLEYVPSQDLAAMEWLGAELGDLLAIAGAERLKARENEFALRIGAAAELIVLDAKAREGGSVTHVSKIGDFFGYDIEHRIGGNICRLEVKGAVESSSKGFFITRNEVMKARRYGDEWVLVQVVFGSGVALKEKITASDVCRVRSISAEQLSSLIPDDTQHFSWVDSARVTPPGDYWSGYELAGVTSRSPVEADGPQLTAAEGLIGHSSRVDIRFP